MLRSEYEPVECEYRAGEIYAFKTEPVHDFDTAETGRYGVIKMLGIKPTPPGGREEDLPCFLVLDGVFTSLPSPDQVRALPALRLNRFSYDDKVAATRVRAETENPLSQFTFITWAALCETDEAVLKDINSWGGLGVANTHVECEWRWRNDRDQFVADVARDEADREARSKADEEKRRQHLASLTFDLFIGGRLFEQWRPYVSERIIESLDTQFAVAATALRDLGARPKRGAVRIILRGLVEDLNALNAEHGGFIETLHREYLCDQLTDLAHLAAQRKLVSEIDDWRDW